MPPLIKFSIVLPTYNRAAFLKKTIGSVQAQTYPNWELIIIDDGSKDNTAEIVAGLMAIDNRIRYYYQDNAERSAARNNGIAKATGDYVCFLDSDDSYSCNHLQVFFDHISKSNTKIALFFTNCILRNSITEAITINPVDFYASSAPEFFLNSSVVPGRICVEKSILLEYNFDPHIVIVEDTDLWFRISCHFPCYYIDENTFIYEIHENNSVNAKFNAYKTRLDGLKKTFNKPEASLVSTFIKKKILSDCYFGIARHYVANKKIWSARLAILEAILFYPDIRLKEKLYLLINTHKLL